ncbi:DUF72 domain-containing protein [Candidatus Bathyarchaeota archaeon]|nr:DUF72 domain-containing protein [Candidatus Bathyarchaeota archaeon]
MQNVHIGTMGWSYKFWKKSFYPNDLDSSKYLNYYSSQFDTVEVNNTFYRIPNEKTVLAWKEQTPPNFIFSLKFPRKITHFKMLTNSEEDTSVFLKRVSLLKEKLGPLLIQFPYNFTEEKLPKLQEFLKILPKKYSYAVEVRNKKLLNDKLFSILKEHNVALAWANHPFLPLVEEITANFLYIRWEGNRKTVNGTLGKTEVDKSESIKIWANKIATHMGSRRIFGYFSKYFSGNPTKDIKEILNTI